MALNACITIVRLDCCYTTYIARHGFDYIIDSMKFEATDTEQRLSFKFIDCNADRDEDGDATGMDPHTYTFDREALVSFSIENNVFVQFRTRCLRIHGIEVTKPGEEGVFQLVLVAERKYFVLNDITDCRGLPFAHGNWVIQSCFEKKDGFFIAFNPTEILSPVCMRTKKASDTLICLVAPDTNANMLSWERTQKSPSFEYFSCFRDIKDKSLKKWYVATERDEYGMKRIVGIAVSNFTQH